MAYNESPCVLQAHGFIFPVQEIFRKRKSLSALTFTFYLLPFAFRLVAVAALMIAMMLASGCASPPEDASTNSNTKVSGYTGETADAGGGADTNPIASSDAGSDANTNASASAASSPPAKEPERYSLTISISGTGTNNGQPMTLPQQQVDFAKKGADRRWAFQLPGLGPAVYLEKSGLRYLVFPSRGQYLEVPPQQLGVRLGDVLTPPAILERMKQNAQMEKLGSETVNGRTAIKYRIKGQAAAGADATAEGDGFIYVDTDTGLPLRAEVNIKGPGDVTARGVIDTLDIALNPDPDLFEVPSGMKKITPEQAKPQVQRFTAFVQIVTAMMRKQTEKPAAPSSNANRSQ